MAGTRPRSLLAGESARRRRLAAELRFGVVVDVDSGAGTVDVDLAGATCRAVPHLASYTSPAVDDVVWLLHQASTLVVIGKR